MYSDPREFYKDSIRGLGVPIVSMRAPSRIPKGDLCRVCSSLGLSWGEDARAFSRALGLDTQDFGVQGLGP